MTKDRVAEALEMFTAGFHCSQSVFAVFSEDFGVPKETALKIACPFGGGLGGYGRTCGAITGAMMVLGLRYGSSDPTDIETKRISREKTRALIESFEKQHYSCNCNDLVGFDRSQLSDADLMLKLPVFHNTCGKFLETVVAYLEEEL
ncbi:MAG TPA: C-GCAxxG-C-C family protein [Bacteroidales bacterium]|nr:C_GCAxxG_C_C family protein [Bacteroidales bacterium]HNZ43372.1 C-GCAxxG-C-C family protein [Bacteroidales bacterium]HOH84034.1 C-GCAxxG-C-C family protein [Bacteroidales bacterium]HPB24186.1 C-GCAxxG-C-C family protein [Bacteroidales bacterium]HPI30910.1 C-GCAxxG-C-C family protein [Bacteroidales bacterium]